jgi:hypothetical protein
LDTPHCKGGRDLCHCDKFLREQLERRKGLLWLTVPEVSVHSPLAPLLLPVVRQNVTAGSMVEHSRQEVERMPELTGFLLLSLLFHLDPSLWDGAGHIQGRTSAP